MFIRRTQTRRTEDGQPYFSHRLVHSERIGNAVRQRTLLNLGRHFDIPQAQWPLLCSRIDDILAGCHRSPNNPQLWSLKTPHLDN